jgi:hypothetical protein
MSIIIVVGIVIMTNCINIALAQPGSSIPSPFGRPSPTSHPPSSPSSSPSHPLPSLTGKQLTMVNPVFESELFKNKAECISYVIHTTKANRNVAAKLCADYGLK